MVGKITGQIIRRSWIISNSMVPWCWMKLFQTTKTQVIRTPQRKWGWKNPVGQTENAKEAEQNNPLMCVYVNVDSSKRLIEEICTLHTFAQMVVKCATALSNYRTFAGMGREWSAAIWLKLLHLMKWCVVQTSCAYVLLIHLITSVHQIQVYYSLGLHLGKVKCTRKQ